MASRQRRFRLADLRRDIRTLGDARHGPVYLVGGAVRDRILRRPARSDFDLAVADGEAELAAALARLGWGSAFRIAAPRTGLSVWRVAGRNATVDVARFGAGETIERDLGRRDFTMNAIAMDLATGRTIDPFGGWRDAVRRRIRAVRETNFDDDPLRLLRAYRLASELGASIARETRGAIRRRSATLTTAAAERTRDELLRLLAPAGPAAARALRLAIEDGVLRAALGGVGGPAARATVSRFLLERSARRAPDRLAVAMRLLGFEGEAAAAALRSLRFPRDFSRRVVGVIRFIAAALSRRPDPRVLYASLPEGPDALDALVSAASGAAERSRARRAAEIVRRANSRPLPVDGDDVSRWLELPPGPALGRALAEAGYHHWARDWAGRSGIRAGLRAHRAEPGTDNVPKHV